MAAILSRPQYVDDAKIINKHAKPWRQILHTSMSAYTS